MGEAFGKDWRGGGEWHIWRDIPPEREEQPAQEAVEGEVTDEPATHDLEGEERQDARALSHLRIIRFESRAGEAVPEEELFEAERALYSTDHSDLGDVTDGEVADTVALPPTEALQRARDAVGECPVPEGGDAVGSVDLSSGAASGAEYDEFAGLGPVFEAAIDSDERRASREESAREITELLHGEEEPTA